MNNLQTIQPTTSQYSTSSSPEIIILPTWIQSRVSTTHQVGTKVSGIFQEKASLEEQYKICKELISTYKGNCPRCSKDIRLSYAGESSAKGESGRELVREDTQEILKMAELGLFKVMITTESDRIARKRSTAIVIRDQLKQLGIQVYAISQPLPLKCPTCFDPLDDDVGIITETIADMKSQLDLSRIRRNYKLGMPKRIQQGKPAGNLAYGLVKKYQVIGKDMGGSDQIKIIYDWDKSKVEILDSIAKGYLSGLGVWGICRKLNDSGIPSPQGSIWRRSTILPLLKNPAYMGLVRWGWKPVKQGKRIIQPKENWLLAKAEYKGTWTEAYFNQIQNEIARRKKVGGRAASSDSLLIGILKCGYCGHSMYKSGGIWRIKGNHKYAWIGYACGAFMHGGTCQHNGIKQEKIDRLIIQEILKLSNDNTRKAFYEKLSKVKKRDLSKELSDKQNYLNKLNKQFQRVTQAYKNGVDTLDEYAKNKADMLPKIKNLEIEIRTIHIKLKQQYQLNWKQQYELAMYRFLQYSNDSEKRIVKTILNKLIDKIEFKKEPFYIKIFYKVDN